MRNDHVRAKRDDVNGWSAKTARSNTRFLQSVTLSELSGHGYAFTLTLKDCPESHESWHKLRKAFLMRIQRMGVIRVHWVTEWQRRGVPHLHGVVYFPDADQSIPPKIISNWLKVAESYNPARWAQHIAAISDSLGWLQYLAKHAARGANHYQRSSDGIPEGWKKTGRIWGKGGDWPIRDPIKFELSREGNFAYRRIIRSYRIAEARSTDRPSTVKYARRMLKCNLQSLSEVRGTSGWIPERVTMSIIHWLASEGHTIEN
tara:strand:- start:38 stop:817 length:780 start_codon:yes stop_codon:yes gene_type:complete